MNQLINNDLSAKWRMIVSQFKDTGILGSQDYFQKVSDNPYTTIKSLEDYTPQPKSPNVGMSYFSLFKEPSNQCMAEDCFDKPFRLLWIWREYYVSQHSSFPFHFDSFYF